MNKIVAIDGPAGSGKGTVSAEVAKRCNLINIDTGATYRCLALAVLKNNLDVLDKEKIIELSKNIKIDFDIKDIVYLNDENVTNLIRTKEVNDIVSLVSSIIEVRNNMIDIQRKMVSNHDVIIEGRDITTVVFPNAKYKFYLDASLEERAKRKFKQSQEQNLNISYDEIYENIKNRDYNDMHKEFGALVRTNEQIYIDTTDMKIEEVVDKIVNVVKGDE